MPLSSRASYGRSERRPYEEKFEGDEKSQRLRRIQKRRQAAGATVRYACGRRRSGAGGLPLIFLHYLEIGGDSRLNSEKSDIER